VAKSCFVDSTRCRRGPTRRSTANSKPKLARRVRRCSFPPSNLEPQLDSVHPVARREVPTGHTTALNQTLLVRLPDPVGPTRNAHVPQPSCSLMTSNRRGKHPQPFRLPVVRRRPFRRTAPTGKDVPAAPPPGVPNKPTGVHKTRPGRWTLTALATEWSGPNARFPEAARELFSVIIPLPVRRTGQMKTHLHNCPFFDHCVPTFSAKIVTWGPDRGRPFPRGAWASPASVNGWTQLRSSQTPGVRLFVAVRRR